VLRVNWAHKAGGDAAAGLSGPTSHLYGAAADPAAAAPAGPGSSSRVGGPSSSSSRRGPSGSSRRSPSRRSILSGALGLHGCGPPERPRLAPMAMPPGP